MRRISASISTSVQPSRGRSKAIVVKKGDSLKEVKKSTRVPRRGRGLDRDGTIPDIARLLGNLTGFGGVYA